MKALHSWLLTEGAHGMISQVEGLAKALNTTFDHKKVKLPFYSKFLPPIITPKNRAFFNYKQLTQDIAVIPDFLISCGRKSVIANVVLKKIFEKKYNKVIQNIHIQDPKISSKFFNFVITPEHDNPLTGRNVLISRGALHYLNEEDVKNTNLKKKKVITCILGGPNKYYDFFFKDMESIFNQLIGLNNISRVNVIASRRTPSDVFEKLRLVFNDKKFNYDYSLQKINYTKSLAEASHIFVTCDSTSMISEAAITGKPIYIVKLKNIKNDYRFKRFFNLFKDLGIIRFFEGSIDNWTYEKLYETKRISKIIIRKTNEHFKICKEQ